MAETLAAFIKGRPLHALLFKMPDKPADMLKRDLQAASIPYRDASGRVADFHALRLLSSPAHLLYAASGRRGGAEGDRTPDLLIANQPLSQLSYGPIPPVIVPRPTGDSRAVRGFRTVGCDYGFGHGLLCSSAPVGAPDL